MHHLVIKIFTEKHMQIDSQQFIIKTEKENSLPQQFSSDIWFLVKNFVEKISATIYFIFTKSNWGLH